MIEDYQIELSLGRADQVGLYLKADEQMAQRFGYSLFRNGFRNVPLMRPNRGAFDYFTYVSIPDSNLDKQGIRERLDAICREHCGAAAQQPSTAVDYADWRAGFDAYTQAYRTQHFLQPDVRPADAFDKGRAYELIRSGRYSEAEQYLQRFASDAPPSLVPAYLVYLYHAWHKPDEVVRVHTRYESLFRSSDVDRRIIEWIVEAYLSGTPPAPEKALAVLDDYLPEFQRQGVSERLLALRAQARALQGQLPHTVVDLRAYLIHTPSARLGEQYQALLEVISGLPAPVDQISALLDELAERIEPDGRWRIQLERSVLARRDERLADALAFLHPVIESPPPEMEVGEQDALRLDAAGLHLDLGQPQEALAALGLVVPENLAPGEQRDYWAMVGRAHLAVEQPGAAVEALHRAYELGTRDPDLLQPLARLAYQAEDWPLASEVYTVLLESDIEPEPQDQLYAGILAWLGDDPAQAKDLLSDALSTWPCESGPSDALALAHQALVESLVALRAPAEEVTAAIGAWIDVLVAQDDLDGLSDLVELISSFGLERPTTFALLEPLEPSLSDHSVGRQRLAQRYVQILCAEVDASLRQGQALPGYVLDLRRGLFALDRAQLDFAQEYLEDELASAREAELIAAEFDLEPAETESLDLSDRWVALIGGYAPMRRRVREILEQDYQLGRFTEVAPSWEDHVDQDRVAEAVQGADLIVVVHRCMKHDGTDALVAAVEGTELTERVRHAAGKGQSSVLRTVLECFGHKCLTGSLQDDQE